MGMLQEFKTFAMRGNVIDMAVGIIIGGAFGKIVTSLVNDVIMPPIGVLIGGVDFSNLKLVIKAAETDLVSGKVTPESTLNYGLFINNIINFLIIAFAIFIMIKAINAFKRKEEEKPAAPAAPPAQEVLLTEIRDLLKNR